MVECSNAVQTYISPLLPMQTALVLRFAYGLPECCELLGVICSFPHVLLSQTGHSPNLL